MEKKRSVGVTIITVVDFSLGIIISLSSLYSIINIKQNWELILVAFNIFIGFILIQLGFKTYKLKPAARRDNRSLGLLGILTIIPISDWSAGFVTKHPTFSFFGYFLFLLPIYFIWTVIYLSLSKVKEQFK